MIICVSMHVRAADHHICKLYKRWQDSPSQTTDVAGFIRTTGRPTCDSGGSSSQPPFRSRLAKYMQPSKACRSRKVPTCTRVRHGRIGFKIETTTSIPCRSINSTISNLRPLRWFLPRLHMLPPSKPQSSIDGRPPSPAPLVTRVSSDLIRLSLRVFEYLPCNLQIHIPLHSVVPNLH